MLDSTKDSCIVTLDLLASYFLRYAEYYALHNMEKGDAVSSDIWAVCERAFAALASSIPFVSKIMNVGTVTKSLRDQISNLWHMFESIDVGRQGKVSREDAILTLIKAGFSRKTCEAEFASLLNFTSDREDGMILYARF